jgi:uncharacterized protein YndB with AHSA1/START domain
VSAPDIEARRTVPARPETIFEFLSDLENHWRIADRFVEVVDLEGPDGARHGGRVRMRGPLGIHRTATTRVVSAQPVDRMRGRAELGWGTAAEVRWTLTPAGEGTVVELAATVESTGLLDRALLALGGRRWLAGRFSSALDRLADAVARS